MGETLKPCPFCGDKAVLKEDLRWHGAFRVECSNCDATVWATGENNPASAIAHWNTRAAPREPGDAERLKDVLDWFNGDGESLVYRAIEDVAEDGRYNAKHVAQYSCNAIARLLREQLLAASRPDAGEGRET